MNRTEYMMELGQRLSPLPLSREDVNDALQFYEEYFDEAGPEREQDVIAELGSPAFVAAQIALKLSTSATPLTEKKPALRKRASVLPLVILGILASPVALPLAIGAAAIIISLVVAAVALVAGFGASGIVCVITGFAIAANAAINLPTDFATALYFIGMGMLTVGIGGFLTRFGLWIGKVCIKGAVRMGSYFFKKRGAGTPDPVADRRHAQ